MKNFDSIKFTLNNLDIVAENFFVLQFFEAIKF